MNPVANGLRRLTVVALLSVGAPVHAEDSASFPDRTCGIGFGFPLNWTLSVAYPKDLACQIELEPHPNRTWSWLHPARPTSRAISAAFTSLCVASRMKRSPFAVVFPSPRRVALHGRFGVRPRRARDRYRLARRACFNHKLLLWLGQETHDYVLGHRLRAVSIGVHGNNLSVVESLLKTLTIQP